MKVTIDIDCTPQEARTFLGLPNIEPMQEALMKQMQDRIAQNLAAMDPEVLLKTWLPASMQGFEQMQKMFWSQFSAEASKNGRK